MKVDYTTWGDTVRMARYRRKLTQRQLASLINVSPSLIGDIERGETRPIYDTVAALCDELDIDSPPALTVEQGEL
jgi:transcriptional regulator with XRE-family HTH domain